MVLREEEYWDLEGIVRAVLTQREGRREMFGFLWRCACNNWEETERNAGCWIVNPRHNGKVEELGN